MKKVFTLSLFLSFIISSFAQITFTYTDVPLAGTTQVIITDSLPLPSVSYGNKGANQTYDFSNLMEYKRDTIEYRALTGGQTTNFPNADVAATLDGNNFLFTNTTNTQLTLEGFQGLINGNSLSASYSTTPIIYQFPKTYNSNFSGNGYLQKTVPASQLGIPLYSQVRLTISSTYTDTTDGWGKVITPIGTYKCLRVKRKETVTTQTEGYLFSWSNIQPTTVKTTVRYTYVTKETKGSAVTFDYDSLENLRSVTYSLIPPAAPIADFGSTTGGGGLVFFTDSTDGYPDTYSWNYGDGSSSGTTQNPNHTYAANGAYYVCLTVTNAGGSNTYCDSVRVTGITSANNPPVAVDDTVSLLQGTNIMAFHVANNDVDPDGNTICMTSVWGSPFVTENIGGSCDMVNITPDSTFVGTDTAWYSLCEITTNPVLCDTGMIIFTVNADPRLLPIAAFTKSTFTYANCLGATTNNNSVNASSLSWTFHPYNPVQPDSVYTTNSVQYYGNMSSTISLQAQVCLTATNQFGTSTKCDTVVLSCTTSLQDVSLSNIRLYPNPATNHVTIDMRNNNDEITQNYTAIEIYNALGEKVMLVGQATNKSSVNVPVSELPQGIYVATIVDSNGSRKTLGRFTKE